MREAAILREISTLCHTVSICPWDSGELHDQSQSLIHSFLVGKHRGYVGGQQDQVRTLPVSVRVFASYPSLEQFG
jgi:hypothetical protein